MSAIEQPAPATELREQEPGRNHYEDGDVFERIAAMKRQPAQQEPLFWYKPHPNGMYNGPIHNAQIGDVLRGSEEWIPLVPLVPSPQPAQQEPVGAECKFDREQKWVRCEIAHHNLVQSEPHNWPGYQTRLLYTSPPTLSLAQRKPLTDEEIEDIWADCPADWDDKINVLTLARAIEAVHDIKENT